MAASDNLGPQWDEYHVINKDSPGTFRSGIIREDFYKNHLVEAFKKPGLPFVVSASSEHIEDPLYGDGMPNTFSGRIFTTRSGKRAAQWMFAASNRIDKTGDPNVLPNGRRLDNPKRSISSVWFNDSEDY